MSFLAQLIASGVLGVVGTCAMKFVDLACSMASVIMLCLQSMEVRHAKDLINVSAHVSLFLAQSIACGLNGLIGLSVTNCVDLVSKRGAATEMFMPSMVASHVKDQISMNRHARSKTAQWIARSVHGW
jgi:hypothetical protein